MPKCGVVPQERRKDCSAGELSGAERAGTADQWSNRPSMRKELGTCRNC
ncbi:MAG: hypothetical protein ACLT2C_07960 [Ruminococcus sp.]|nr:hypothetical protein [Ruminococcus callidus]MCB5776238.1 hypothetical protein [Ruminococcus callidus]